MPVKIDALPGALPTPLVPQRLSAGGVFQLDAIRVGRTNRSDPDPWRVPPTVVTLLSRTLDTMRDQRSATNA